MSEETKKEDVVVEENTVETGKSTVETETTETLTREEATKPLTQEEVDRNKAEELRKALRVLQIVQHPNNGRIEIMPIQNIRFRTDIVGILLQALNNLQNEDIMRSQAALLRETITLIKEPAKENTTEEKK